MLSTPIDAIALFARSRPAKLAATELASGASWSFAELDDATARMANYLLQRGCKFGDRVAVLARNSVSQVILHFACARVGLIYVPLNWRLSATELSAIIARVRPRLILCDELSAPLLSDQELSDRAASLSEFVASSFSVSPLKESVRSLDNPSLILFTSGTSGKSKGVLLTERNLMHSGINFAMLTSVDGSSCFLCETPMFHTIGLVANIRSVLQLGGSILVSDGFQPERTLAWLCSRELGITHYVGVPQMIEGFRRQPGFDPAALRKMTALVTGGAPHAVEDVAAWLDDGVNLVCGFGMSEAGTVFGMPPDVDVIRDKIGSTGLPAPTLEVRLVDSDNNDCPRGQPGELWLRGDAVMLGYWEDEQVSAESFADGDWFKTGDVVRCDEDGFFWIVDRKKDMFISGGENIYPAEIEMIVTGYAGVREAAVVGIEDERWGEVGCLVVVAEDNQTINDAALIDYLQARLASYKIPKRIVYVEALPRTSTGKLQKPQLKDWLSRQ